MKRSEVAQWFIDNNLDVSTLDFYVIDNEDTGEPESQYDSIFGRCDVSGIKGSIVSCYCLTIKDRTRVHLNIGDWLVSGPVGKLAGAF